MCREHLNIVFIGHVDAGKSTTGGQILYLTVSRCLYVPVMHICYRIVWSLMGSASSPVQGKQTALHIRCVAAGRR